jgi:hypothetical protein
MNRSPSLIRDFIHEIDSNSNTALTTTLNNGTIKQNYKLKSFNYDYSFNLKDVINSTDDSIIYACGSTSANDIKFIIGDLVWAKVSGHPWWPCMISQDPNENNTYMKAIGLSRPKRLFYVEFFGPSIEHAWVAEGCLIEYKGIDAFKEYAQRQVDQAPTKSQKEKLAERFQLKVAISRREHWEQAVQEADEAIIKTIDKRRESFSTKLDSKKTNEKESCTLITNEFNQNNHQFGDSDEENLTPSIENFIDLNNNEDYLIKKRNSIHNCLPVTKRKVNTI